MTAAAIEPLELITLAIDSDIVAGVRCFDRGVPTDVIDTSRLTGGLEHPGLGPAELRAGDPARPHPLATTAPGPELGTLLDIYDTATLTDAGLVAYVAACERQKAWLDARAVAATAELTARCARLRGVGTGADEVAAEVMAATELAAGLALSQQAARNRVGLAGALDRLPSTRLALSAGRIDLAKARAIADTVAGLDDTDASAVESRVLARAPEQTVAMLRAALRRAVLSVNPATAEQRHAVARADRGVWPEPLPDGMAWLHYLGSAADVHALYTWLSAKAVAAGGPGDDRSLDQRRADVLADLGHHGLATEDLPRRHGRRPQIGVVVALSTLLRLDDEPGELVGHGPITAETARRIAADGTWRRLLVEPFTGRLLEISTETHDPPQELRDFVLTRDRTCRGIGCRRPADQCDLDHRVPSPDGPTTATNLDARCRTEHRVRTKTDTRIDADGCGGLIYTLPSGRRYHRPADPVLDHPALLASDRPVEDAGPPGGTDPPPDGDIPPGGTDPPPDDDIPPGGTDPPPDDDIPPGGTDPPPDDDIPPF